MRIAFDSNILAYLASVRTIEADDPKIARVQAISKALRPNAVLVAPVQALGELFVVLRRGGVAPELARQRVDRAAEGLITAPSTSATLTGALDLAVEHKLQFWDSLILTAASEAGCSLLLSEDMQHGFVSRGVTIVNPLAESPHPQLARLLAPAS